MTHLLRSLHILGIKDVFLDVGHVAILKPLMHSLHLSDASVQKLLALVQSKNTEAITELLLDLEVAASPRQIILDLTTCYGGTEVLAQAERIVKPLAGQPVYSAIIQPDIVAAARQTKNLRIFFTVNE